MEKRPTTDILFSFFPYCIQTTLDEAIEFLQDKKATIGKREESSGLSYVRVYIVKEDDEDSETGMKFVIKGQREETDEEAIARENIDEENREKRKLRYEELKKEFEEEL